MGEEKACFWGRICANQTLRSETVLRLFLKKTILISLDASCHWLHRTEPCEWFERDDLGIWDIFLAVNAPFHLIWLLIRINLRSYLYREAFDLNCAWQENRFYSTMNPIFPFTLSRSATDSFLSPTAQGEETKRVLLAPAGWLISLVPPKQNLRGSLFIFLNYLYILHA